MAKPGSREARAVANGRAVDLRKHAPVPDVMAQKVREQAEAQLGMRCGGCGKRIGVGLQFTRIDVERGADGRPAADVMKLSACSGANDCDFAARARENADVIEMVEFVWLSGEAPVGAHESLPDAVQRVQDQAGERDRAPE